MAVTYTTNKSLAQVTVGTEVGTWGPFINANEGILDNTLGGTATVPLLAANVILSSAQYQCGFIQFTGAITADLTITFPNIGSFYTIINDTTNSSAFCLTLATTVAGSRAMGVPPGAITEILTDGSNVRFRALPHPGSYWDYAGSSVPRWVSACTIPPWLYCNGTTFSSGTYPALNVILGSTTLPDLRGRLRAYYNDGTGRITAAGGGVDGNTLYSAGGLQTTTISSIHIPNYALPVTDPGHTHTQVAQIYVQGGSQEQPGANNGKSLSNAALNSAVTGITVNSGGGGQAFPNLPPLTIGGITMIRAA